MYGTQGSYRESVQGGIPLTDRPPRSPGAPGPGRSGRTTPRESQLGRHAGAENGWKRTLRPEEHVRRPRRASSAGPATSRRDAHYGNDYKPMSAAEKVDGKDGDWRCGSYRYANAQFYSTLREWTGKRDVADSTPPDWRVHGAPGSGTTYKGSATAAANWGHDMSLNDADGWKRSSTPWVEKSFREGLRAYAPSKRGGGVIEGDVAYDEEGRPKEVTKDQKHKAPVGESLGSIYRSSKQANVLTTANADDFFMGSLRSAPMQSAAEYQRNRRAKLNLPQYKELTPAEISKAKRVWDSIDLDNSGTIDVEELKKFLVALGHRATDKNVQKLINAAEHEAADMKQRLRDFAKMFHGISLPA